MIQVRTLIFSYRCIACLNSMAAVIICCEIKIYVNILQNLNTNTEVCLKGVNFIMKAYYTNCLNEV